MEGVVWEGGGRSGQQEERARAQVVGGGRGGGNVCVRTQTEVKDDHARTWDSLWYMRRTRGMLGGSCAVPDPAPNLDPDVDPELPEDPERESDTASRREPSLSRLEPLTWG